MRWVIGIVVAVVLVIIGYQYFGREQLDVAEQPAVTEQPEGDVAEQAEQAAEETEQAAEETAEAVEETAEEAATATEQAGQQAAETAEQAAEATEGAAQQAQETAEQATAGAQQATEQAAEATEEAAQQAQETAEQATAGAQQATEQAAEATQGAAQQAQETAEQAAEATQEAAQATEEAAEETAAGAQEAVEETLTEAQTAALTVGDVNVGEQVTGIVEDVEESLQGVTDAQSAEAAVATLNDINARLEELSGTVDQLPDDAKKVLGDVLNERVAELKTLADDVSAREGVGEVVNPALQPIIAKLQDWAQQPA
jgi:chromosome segregation ATPase